MIADVLTEVDAGSAFRLTQLLARCAQAIDDDRLETWPSFFAEHATYSIVPRENVDAGYAIAIIYCRGTDMMHDRVLAIRKASVFGPHRYRHILSTPVFDGADDGAVSATTSFIVSRIKGDAIERGIAETFAVGEYRDLFVREGEGWAIARRLVILDNSLVSTLLVMPL